MSLKIHVLLALLIMILLGAAMPSWQLSPNQTAPDAAANMTRALMSNNSGITCPAIRSANVQIKPNICIVEVTARCYSYVGRVVAPLYASYLKTHPDYMGTLVINVYNIDKLLLLTTTISNEDARSNYDGISYLLEKNADVLQYPAKRTDGLETPMGY